MIWSMNIWDFIRMVRQNGSLPDCSVKGDSFSNLSVKEGSFSDLVSENRSLFNTE